MVLRNLLSSPRRQSAGQPWGKVGGQDLLLRPLKIVRRPVKSHSVLIAVKDAETGSPIPIARLPDRTRIDEVLHSLFQSPSKNITLIGCAIGRTQPAALGWVGAKCSLYVRVSKERQRNRRHQERLYCIPRSDEIIGFIQWRPVDKLHVREPVDLDRTLWQRPQPLQAGGADVLPRPQSCKAGYGIEVLEVSKSCRRLVVISTNKVLA